MSDEGGSPAHPEGVCLPPAPPHLQVRGPCGSGGRWTGDRQYGGEGRKLRSAVGGSADAIGVMEAGCGDAQAWRWRRRPVFPGDGWGKAGCGNRKQGVLSVHSDVEPARQERIDNGEVAAIAPEIPLRLEDVARLSEGADDAGTLITGTPEMYQYRRTVLWNAASGMWVGWEEIGCRRSPSPGCPPTCWCGGQIWGGRGDGAAGWGNQQVRLVKDG